MKWPMIALDDMIAKRVGTVDPSKFPDEVFDLYSIPAFDRLEPDVIAGSEIGSSKQVVATNDLLLSKIVPHIRRAWTVGDSNGRRLIASGEWIVFRSRQFFPGFLRHYLVSDGFHSQFMQTVSGVGGSLLRARPAEVAKIKIPLPSLSEQKRIAGILDQADGLRRKRQQALALTDQFLRSTFLDLFGDPVTNPKRWLVRKLGDHLTFLTTGSRGWAEHYSNSGARFVRSLDVQMNFISDDDIAWVNAPAGTEADRTRVQPDDVLLTVTSSKIGRVAPVPSDIGEAYISQHVALMRVDGSLRPRFRSMFLSDLRGGQQQIRRMQYGQTKPGLNLEQLRAFRIPCPPLPVQDNFLAQWDQLQRCHRRLEMSSLQSDALFNSLVQRAFRGEL